jgi:ribosomal protein S18 acetylase RimI-like enzyme
VITVHDVHVIDLSDVAASELSDLWQYEMRLWRERLLWDISSHAAALRRILRRGALLGKAVRVNDRTVAYAYYGISGPLGVVAGLTVLPEWTHTEVGETLLNATIQAMQRRGLSRIECRFIAADCPWLGTALEAAGFHIYWREFLRRELAETHQSRQPMAGASLQPWHATHLSQAAVILQAAYLGSIEAEMLALYRSIDGCRSVLEQIVNQGSCGVVVPEASLLAHDRGTSLGFVMVTEVAPRQAHLPQLAVLPAYQRQGIGRGLLDHSLRRLCEGGYETLSLIVSRANERALRLYYDTGFQAILSFPVGIWGSEAAEDGSEGGTAL